MNLAIDMWVGIITFVSFFPFVLNISHWSAFRDSPDYYYGNYKSGSWAVFWLIVILLGIIYLEVWAK